MKRHENLQKLSREHHGSLSMAKKIAAIAETGDQQALIQAIETVRDYYDTELEAHFQHEEQTLFAPIFKHYREYIDLAKPLLKEHGFLRILVQRITPETAREDLRDFATILAAHTRVEERQLFPVIEKHFTEEQFKAVTDFTPL